MVGRDGEGPGRASGIVLARFCLISTETSIPNIGPGTADAKIVFSDSPVRKGGKPVDRSKKPWYLDLAQRVVKTQCHKLCVLVFQKTCLQTQIQCSGAFGRDYGTHQRWLCRRKCSNCLKTMVWADFVVERCWWCRVELTKCPRTSDAFRRTIMLLGSVFSRAFGQSQDVPNPWFARGEGESQSPGGLLAIFCVFHGQMMAHCAGTWRDFFQTPFPAPGYRYRHIFPRKSDPRPRTSPLRAEKIIGRNEDPTPGSSFK